jgi:tape measure domain-containing protein
MATEQIGIRLFTTGARTVRRDLETIGVSAGKAQTSVTLLRRSLGLLGAGAVIRQYAVLSDEFITIQNRLKIVTSGTKELAEAQKSLLSIANETRSSFRGTTELYVRLSLASKALGIEQDRLLPVTRSINQAILLSGATAREAEAGLIQLSQGIAANRLGGDELRSVLEQLPVVADVISKSLGITRGELRLMGEEGKLTGEVIVKAFEEAREELSEKFAKQVPTIGQQLTVLRNVTVDFVGQLNQTTGALSKVTSAIQFLADNIGILLTVVIAFGTFMAGQLLASIAVKSWLALTAAVKGLTVAFGLARAAGASMALIFASNPIGLFLGLFATFAGLLVAFADEIRAAGKAVDDFFTSLLSPSENANTALEQTIFFAKELRPAMQRLSRVLKGDVAAINENFTEAEIRVRGFSEALFQASRVADTVKLGGKDNKQIIKSLNDLRGSLDPVIAATNKLKKAEELLSAAIRNGNIELEEAERIYLRLRDTLEEDLNPALALQRKFVSDSVTSFRNLELRLDPTRRAYNDYNEAIAEVNQTLDAELVSEQRAIEVKGLLKKALEDELKAINRGRRARGQSLAEQIRGLQEGVLPATKANREFAEALALVTKAVDRKKISDEQGNLILQEYAKSLVEGLGPAVLGDVRISVELMEAAVAQLSLQFALGAIEGDEFAKKLFEIRKAAGLAADSLVEVGLNAGESDFAGAPRAAPIREERLPVDQFKDLNNELIRQQDIFRSIQEPLLTYDTGMDALNVLLEQGKISTAEFDRESKKLQATLDSATGFMRIRTEAQATQDAIDQIALTIRDTGTQLETTMVNAFTNSENALVKFVRTWEISAATIRDLINGILDDLARLLIRQAGLALIGGGGPAQPSPEDILKLGGLQHGGQFTVGGSGGPDSQLVAFRASPGEEITAVPKGLRGDQFRGQSGPPTVNTKAVFVMDMEQAVLEVLSSEPGQRVQMTTISNRRRQVKRLL